MTVDIPHTMIRTLSACPGSEHNSPVFDHDVRWSWIIGIIYDSLYRRHDPIRATRSPKPSGAAECQPGVSVD